MKEVLNFNKNDIIKSNILKTLNLKKNKYFLVSSHREEIIEDINKFNDLVKLLNFLSEKIKLDVIVSTHPRTKNKINFLKIKFNKRVKLLKPLGYFDYNKLKLNAKIVFSDSGTISEESSILNFKALNIREVMKGLKLWKSLL